jgi:hypothetical protein
MKDKNNLIIILFFITLIIIILGLIITPQTETYSDNHPMLDRVREAYIKLNPKYGEIPLREGTSAYTENKKVITLCLKDPYTNTYYDFNTIMYVALHELAHVISPSIGHGPEFKKNFSILLREGAKIGIYNPRKEIPQTYCGVGPND